MKDHEKSAVVPSVAPSASPVPNGGTLHLSAPTPWPVGAGLAEGDNLAADDRFANQNPLEIVEAFRQAHVNVVILVPGDKVAATKWEQKNRGRFIDDHDMVKAQMELLSNFHWGIVTARTEYHNGLIVIDFDTNDAATQAWIDEHMPPTPLMVYSRRGIHFYYRSPDPNLHTLTLSIGPVAADGKRHADFKAGPGLVVAPGATNTTTEWTYRAECRITANLLMSLPELPMWWIEEHVKRPNGHGLTSQALPVYMGKADGFSLTLDLGATKQIVAARKLTKGSWHKCMCPHHVDNIRTGHASARRDAAGNVHVRCFLDQITYHYGEKEVAAPVESPEDLGVDSVTVKRLDAEDALLVIPPDSEAMVQSYAARAVNYARVSEWRFREKWTKAGITPPTQQCVSVNDLLKSNHRDEHIVYPRTCNDLACFWCGPRLLATKVAALATMPQMDSDGDIVGFPMCDKRLYVGTIEPGQLAQWSRLFSRLKNDRLEYYIGIGISPIRKSVDQELRTVKIEGVTQKVVDTSHAYVAFRMGPMVVLMSTIQVTSQRQDGLHVHYTPMKGRRRITHYMTEFALATYTVECDVSGVTTTGRITTSQNLCADPDKVRSSARTDTFSKVGKSLPLNEARAVLDERMVDYRYTSPTTPTDPEERQRRGNLKARRLDAATIDALLLEKPQIAPPAIDMTDCAELVDQIFNEVSPCSP